MIEGLREKMDEVLRVVGGVDDGGVIVVIMDGEGEEGGDNGEG